MNQLKSKTQQMKNKMICFFFLIVFSFNFSNAQFNSEISGDFDGRKDFSLKQAFEQRLETHVLVMDNWGKYRDELLYELSDSVCEFINLESIDINGNLIKKLPPCFSKLVRLKELRFSMNDFREFPKELLALDSLKVGLFYMTEIDSLPENISQMKSLEYLSFRLTDLEYIPESFGDLQNLKELELNGCKIVSLPNSMGKLKQLQHLSMSHLENLMYFPQSIFELKGLKSIFFKKEDFKRLKLTKKEFRQKLPNCELTIF